MSYTSAINITLDAFCVVLSIVLLGCLRYNGQVTHTKMQSFFSVMLFANLTLSVSSLISWRFDGGLAAYTYPVLVVSNFILYLCWYIIMTYSSIYMFTYASLRAKVSAQYPLAFYAIGIASIAVLVISQFTGWIYRVNGNNMFQRNHFFWIAYIGPVVIIMLNLSLLFIHRLEIGLKDVKTFLIFELMPLIALIVLFFHSGVLLLNSGLTLSLLIIYIKIQSEGTTQLELELTNTRIDVMLSQIQPHFIYNTLATIEAFCDKGDSKEAAVMVRDFSHYLRENMDSLTQKELVSFKREMAHIQIYLAIEQKRLMERLFVVYHLATTEFQLPILTVQPLVENAVRYGVSKKRYGGTVTLCTHLVPGGVKIIVSDDGVGFDAKNLHGQDKHSHIGIENVRERIRSQSGGTLTIESEIGKGTVCTIFLPQGNGH